MEDHVLNSQPNPWRRRHWWPDMTYSLHTHSVRIKTTEEPKEELCVDSSWDGQMDEWGNSVYITNEQVARGSTLPYFHHSAYCISHESSIITRLHCIWMYFPPYSSRWDHEVVWIFVESIIVQVFFVIFTPSSIAVELRRPIGTFTEDTSVDARLILHLSIQLHASSIFGSYT